MAKRYFEYLDFQMKGGHVRAGTLNQIFQQIEMGLSNIESDIDKSIRFSQTVAEFVIPGITLQDRANHLMGFNEDGEPAFISHQFFIDLADSANSNANAALHSRNEAFALAQSALDSATISVEAKDESITAKDEALDALREISSTTSIGELSATEGDTEIVFEHSVSGVTFVTLNGYLLAQSDFDASYPDKVVLTNPAKDGEYYRAFVFSGFRNDGSALYDLLVDQFGSISQVITSELGSDMWKQKTMVGTLDEEITGESLVGMISTSVGGTAWKGANGLPPKSKFTLDKVVGIAPETFTLTNQSTAGDNAIESATLSFSDGRSNISLSDNTVEFTINQISQSVTLTLTVVDTVGNTGISTAIVSTTDEVRNVPPVISNQSFTIEEDAVIEIDLGPVNDGDGDAVTYTVVSSAAFNYGPASNQITFTESSIGSFILNVTADDGEDTDTAIIDVTVLAAGSIAFPIINKPIEQFIPMGGLLTLQPSLSNGGSISSPIWSLDYGHDDISIDPITGEITWDTAALSSADSFHIGIKCANENGIGRKEFIVHVGKILADIVYAGPGAAYPTIKDAFAVMTSGQTLVLKSGNYRGDDNCMGRTILSELNQYPPSGLANKHTTIMAEESGKAVFDDGTAKIKFALYAQGKNEACYLSFRGLHFKGGSTISIAGDTNDKANTRVHHIKYVLCGAQGVDNVPIYTRIGDYILYENCYAFGGGRYKIQANECTKVVIRRSLARYDRSDRDAVNDPKGGIMFYNVVDGVLQNSFADIDGLSKFTSNGELVGAVGTPVTGTGQTTEGSFIEIDRCIQLNSELRFANFDMQLSSGGGCSDAVVNNFLSYDVRPDSFYAYNYGYSLLNRMTIGKIEPRFDTTYGMINTGGWNYFGGIKDSILHDIQFTNGGEWLVRNMSLGTVPIPYGAETWRTAIKYGLMDNNLTSWGGTTLLNNGDPTVTQGTTAIDITPDFKHLIRLEDSSSISDSKGAEIMTLIGKSETFYGDPGFKDETNLPMWPFPAEEHIRTLLHDYTEDIETYTGSNYHARAIGPVETIDGSRGCAADGSSITNYVWGYLGYTIPPMNIVAIPGDSQLTITWAPHLPLFQGTITSYNVYDFNPGTKTKSNPRSVASNVFEETITGLNNGFKSYFVVTAVDSVKGESEYSYVAIGTPNGVPTQAPVIDLDPLSADVIEGDTITLTAEGQGYQSISWYRDGVDTGETGNTYSFVSALSDNGVSITAVFTNVVDSTVSAPASIAVTSVDTTAPSVSIAITGSTMNITLSDNIYPNSDISLQILDDGIPIGSSFMGDVTAYDLTSLPLSTGERSISLRATDEQTNAGVSNAVLYSVGVAIFTDNFSDASNWSGNMTVANNEATLSGTSRLVSNIWNGAASGSIKFDMKILTEMNDYENNDMYFGVTTSGTRTNAIRLQFKDRQDRDINLYHYVNGSILGSIAEKGSGFGNSSSSPVSGTEVWKTIEMIVSGTNFILKVDDVTVADATLPQDINPLTGGFEFDPYDSVDCMVIRNFNAY